MKSINIKFPLGDDVNNNTFLQTNQVTKNAYSSDLLLLLLTQKGERYYESNYGTNLLKYIFEVQDSITSSDVEEEIKNTVKLYIPALTINRVNFLTSLEDNTIPENQLIVDIKFTYQEDSFSEEGSVSITF